jgi:zinc transport system permease protein
MRMIMPITATRIMATTMQGTRMDEFFWRAVLAGVGLAAIAGPLGSFVVWRRMAFFGDALAHSALLGVALGFLLHIEVNLAIATLCAIFAMVLTAMLARARLAPDTLLSICAFTALSVGLVAISFVEDVRVDLIGYLFGDILAVGRADLAWIWGGAAAGLGLLAFLWRPLLAVTVHADLAAVEGVNVGAMRLVFVLLLAVLVAVAMKIVGVLLVTALLVMPAAAARRFARSPESMAAIASGIGAFASVAGLLASVEFDTPSGPSVVVAAASVFAVSLVLPQRR